MVLIIALAGAFLFGLWKLYELRFTAGDIYPQYSSLRADPLGTKALYESLQQIPDISTARNYREIESLPKGKSTVLFLGENPFLFELMPQDQIKEYEALAASGARVVIALRPGDRQRDGPPDKKPTGKKRTTRSRMRRQHLKNVGASISATSHGRLRRLKKSRAR